MNKKISVIIVLLIAVIALVIVFILTPPAIDFTAYEAGQARKDAFVGHFQPIIAEENTRLRALRKELLALDETSRNKSWVQDLAIKYRVEDYDGTKAAHWDELLIKVGAIPVSLSLAQAANESSWGTSRFARVANNFFGHWCFEKGCGVVPNSRNAGASHEVADFDSSVDSVKSYMLNLNRHYAYTQLRAIRNELRSNQQSLSGAAMAGGLVGYSERGEAYIEELREMIRFNQWAQFD
ncbi:glucosaminidase domain-containing protein [Dasania marina]|uniref:glucosaminidase domain-containing protein n=1 Tax=Dasania marina TaxID=471499 RepID=UPI0003636545|nr:glucosaminidase domain-containing protein [Dasania marina]